MTSGEHTIEVLAPIIISTMQQEVTWHCKRVTKLFVYDIVEKGMARRRAGAVVRDIGRLKQDEPERNECIKEAAWNEARQMLARTRIDQVLRIMLMDIHSVKASWYL